MKTEAREVTPDCFNRVSPSCDGGYVCAGITYSNSDDPKHPSPSQSLDEEPSTYWTNHGPEDRPSRPQCHGSSSLARRHHVDNATAADRQNGHSREAGQEPKGDQHAYVRRKRARDREDGKCRIANVIHQVSSVHFAEGG